MQQMDAPALVYISGFVFLIPPFFVHTPLFRLSLRECPIRLHRVPKPGDGCATLLHTRVSGTLVRGGGTLYVTVIPDVVSILPVCVGANNCLQYISFICFNLSVCLSWGGIFSLARLTLGDLLSISIPDLVGSLISTKGWVRFFSFSGVCFSLFPFPFFRFWVSSPRSSSTSL